MRLKAFGLTLPTLLTYVAAAYAGPPVIDVSVERGSIRVDWQNRGPRPRVDYGCTHMAQALRVDVWTSDDTYLLSQSFYSSPKNNGTVFVGDNRLIGRSGLQVRALTLHRCTRWNVYSERSRLVEDLDLSGDNLVSGFTVEVTRNLTGEPMTLLSTPGMPNTAVFAFGQSNPAVYVKILNHCAESDKRHHALDIASTTGEELTIRVWHPRTEYDYQARTYRVGGINRVLEDRISGRPCEK